MNPAKNEFSLTYIPPDLDGILALYWQYRPKYCKFLMSGIISLLEQFFLLLITFCTYFVICTYIF